MASKGSGPWKGIALIGGLIGLFSVLAYFISQSLGAWWQMTVDPLIGSDQAYYMSGFGFFIHDNIDSEDMLALGALGIISGVLVLLGSLLVIIFAIKEQKGIAILSSIIMFAGIGLFFYALSDWTDSQDIIAAIDWLSSDEHNIFFGSFQFFGEFVWRIGNGLFFAIGGAVIALIGAAKMNA